MPWGLPVTSVHGRLAVLKPPPLARQTGIYTASQLAGRAIPFLLLPILTRYLSPQDYGIVTMFLLVAVLVEPFVGLGLGGAITVRYFDEQVDAPTYLGTGIGVVTMLAIPALALTYLFREPLSVVTQVPPGWLLLVVPLALARVIGATPLALLRVREKAAQFSLAQNAQTVGLFALALVLVVTLGLGWQGRVLAEAFAWVAFAGIGAAWMWRRGWLAVSFNRAYARDLAGFGLPLIPHLLGSILILQIDRLLLTNMVGVDETGLYAVGFQLAIVIELVAVSFNSAYAPWLFRRLADADDGVRRQLVLNTYRAFAGIAVLAMFTAVVMPVVGELVLDPSYSTAAEFVPWFAVGFMFSGMYYLVTNYIFYARRNGWLAVGTAITAAVNLVLTYLLISANGAIGAAQATAITYGLLFVITWAASQRAYPMPWLSFRARAVEPDVSGRS